MKTSTKGFELQKFCTIVKCHGFEFPDFEFILKKASLELKYFDGRPISEPPSPSSTRAPSPVSSLADDDEDDHDSDEELEQLQVVLDL